MEWGVERALLDLEDFVRDLLDAFGDGPAVFGFEGDGFENQEVQCALHEIVWFAHTVIIYNNSCGSSPGMPTEVDEASHCDVRPRLAEHVLNGIKKGAHVLVEGSLLSSTCEQANGKGKKAKTAKITSRSIRADVVRKLNRGEPELETGASGSGVASAPARFSKLYFPLRRPGRGFESRRFRQFPSAWAFLKRQSKNSATHNAGKMKKKANSLVCQVCQLRAP